MSLAGVCMKAESETGALKETERTNEWLPKATACDLVRMELLYRSGIWGLDRLAGEVPLTARLRWPRRYILG